MWNSKKLRQLICWQWPALCLLPPLFAWANGARAQDVQFQDIAAADGAGIAYRRERSPRDAIWQAIKAKEVMRIPEDLLAMPIKSRGIPGVALFDYDRDGDLDIYVTNGPGAPNSLYANQFSQTRRVSFVDVALAAGVDATDQDSSGVCFGDIDNDGDEDLYVLGTGEPNRLFENNGDGTFSEISVSSATGGGNLWSSSAAMGDINNDGLLDIYVGNAGKLTDYDIIAVQPFIHNEHNQLFLNQGGNQFADVSDSSGIRELNGLEERYAGSAGVTWAVAMVDYDLDGDIDIFNADDQAGFVEEARGGLDRGILHIFQNDGTGQFSDVCVEAGLDFPGAYMGLSFADFNADGHLDFFVSNLGTYNGAPNDEANHRVNASRWLLGGPDGRFTVPAALDDVNGTPFGWGTSARDYDNDGDSDIIFYGGLDVGSLIFLTNPGAILQNDGNAHFTYDARALADSTDHTRRVVHGMAMGDLDGNGFLDIVTASNFNIPADVPIRTFEDRDGAFDGLTHFLQPIVAGETFGSQRYDPSLPDFPAGTLSIEMNDGANRNRWMKIRPMGTAGLISGGKANRDGIGAVITFRRGNGKPVMQPILGGSSYASQDALEANFGMANSRFATVDILWPGGTRNRLYAAFNFQRYLFPEIPVSYDDLSLTPSQYARRVDRALEQLLEKNYLSPRRANLFRISAIIAYKQYRAEMR